MVLDELRRIKSEKKDLRSFGITVGIAFVVLGGILFWLKKGAYPYVSVLGIVFVLSGLAVPSLLKPIQKLWMGISVLIGWVMTRVILGISFYLILTPIALVGRLCGKEFLELKIEKSRQSYWSYREPKEFDPAYCDSQF